MSYPDQGPPRRDMPPPGQPMLQPPTSWPQHGHPARPPAYGAPPPPYGTPAPAYGTAAPGGYRARRRPGVVTAAAVMAFVVGAGIMLVNLFALLLLPSTHDTTDTWLRVVGLVRLALGALFIWGGIAALKGHTRTVLLVVSVVETIFSFLLLAFSVVFILVGFVFIVPAAFELIFVVIILILILQRESRDFFRARGESDE